ncbi:MAG: thiamine pyrophosphate-binding protein [Chloroflexi bacterium]|nr:thiamine pyrophosphate-binding protein [Chloroflexota bacterium]
MTAVFEWDAVVGADPLHLPVIGAMGKASSVALGLALAQPRRQVLCLDGDGSLLMNLGSLVTIAGAAPPNLVHFVFENRVYNITGGQPLPAAGKVDFALMARAAGYPLARTFTHQAQLEQGLPELLSTPGPVFACLQVEPAGPQPKLPQGRMRRHFAALQRLLAEQP